MTGTEMVTSFQLKDATIRELLRAITAHCKKQGVEAEEYEFGVAPHHWSGQIMDRGASVKLPDMIRYRWLIAFAVEGANEGYYCHVGGITRCDSHLDVQKFEDFGFAKTNSAENAYALAKEAQRFLTAALWN